MQEQVYDVVVVGAGIMGLSSALFCRKQGLKVILVEQFPHPHTRGSSHGGSRITRKAYMESAVISKMMNESHELWKMLETETNSKIFWPIGTIYMEKKPSPLVRKMAEVNDRYGYKYSILDGVDMKNRYNNVFGGYDDCLALLDHEGGLLRADVACAKTLELYKKLGGEFRDLFTVKGIKTEGGITLVQGQNGETLRTKKLILSVGAWTEKISEQLSLKLPLRVEAISVTFWKAKDNSYSEPSKMPCFMDISNDTYGLPSFEYPGLVKVVMHASDETCDPDKRDVNQFKIERLMQFYEPYIKKHFPNLTTPPAVVDRCMYTRTPDNIWIIDKHPSNENIVILAGFSGHGFKAGPIVGKIASQLVMGYKVDYDLTEFGISRFKKNSKL